MDETCECNVHRTRRVHKITWEALHVQHLHWCISVNCIDLCELSWLQKVRWVEWHQLPGMSGKLMLTKGVGVDKRLWWLRQSAGRGQAWRRWWWWWWCSGRLTTDSGSFCSWNLNNGIQLCTSSSSSKYANKYYSNVKSHQLQDIWAENRRKWVKNSTTTLGYQHKTI